jgi:hypothetical protein
MKQRSVLHSSPMCSGGWDPADMFVPTYIMQETGKAAQLSIAQCIAVLCTAAGAKQTSSTVTKLLQTLQARMWAAQSNLSVHSVQ